MFCLHAGRGNSAGVQLSLKDNIAATSKVTKKVVANAEWLGH
jgi:hypothetical protein